MSGKFPVLLFSTRFTTLCWSEDKKKDGHHDRTKINMGKVLENYEKKV